MTGVTLSLDKRDVATLTIDRAEVHNAFDDQLIEQLLEALDQVELEPKIRALILRSNGNNFSAGADLRWMRRMADYSREENHADAMKLARLMKKLNRLSRPTVAQVQGAALGGGVGLVACCDIAVAAADAVFALSEVRLGLIPAVISPYVIAAIGERAARRYFLTAERFNAVEAHRLGLVHEIVDETALDGAANAMVDHLLKGGPAALTSAKELIFSVARQPITNELIIDTAERITDIRASEEGRGGVTAFLQKRAAPWSE